MALYNAVGLGYTARRREFAMNSFPSTLLAVAVLAGALGCSRPAKTNPKPFEAMSEVLAREALKLVPGKGRVVVVAFDPGADKMRREAWKMQWESFQRAIKKPGATVTVTVDVLTAHGDDRFGPSVMLTAAQFFQLFAKHPQADVIVSFVGLPVFQAEDFARVPEKTAKFVGFGAATGPAQRLLDEHVVDVIVTARTAQDWDKGNFEAVTADAAPHQ